MRSYRQRGMALLLLALAITLLVVAPGRAFANPPAPVMDTSVLAQAQPNDEDRVSLNDDLVIRTGEVVARDATAVNGDIELESGSYVTRDVTASGDIEIAGKVGGNVTSLTGDIELRDGAVINGNVTANAGSVDVSRSAKVVGAIVQATDNSVSDRHSGFGDFLATLLLLLFLSTIFVVVGAVVVMAWPRRVQLATATLRSSLWPVLVIGVLSGLLLPFVLALASVVLAVTIIGILVIPFVWVAFFALWVYGCIVLSLWLGQRVAESGRFPAANDSLLLTAAVGLIALSGTLSLLVALIPPIGLPLAYMVGFVGASAAVLSRFGSQAPLNRVSQIISTGAGRVTRRLGSHPTDQSGQDQGRRAS